jgi:hypothetical protein
MTERIWFILKKLSRTCKINLHLLFLLLNKFHNCSEGHDKVIDDLYSGSPVLVPLIAH